MDSIINFIKDTLNLDSITNLFEWNDIVEIIIITILFYYIMLWIKSTRAWSLMKGFLVLLIFILLANVFQMTTLLWLINNTLNIGIIALVILFQPELRRILEQLGSGNVFTKVFSSTVIGTAKQNHDLTRVIEELVRATFEMSEVNTGALMVIEDNSSLVDFERTGIRVDALVSSQLLLNIFEHNTPLHDGAAIIKNDRIISATCYLPLSDNLDISKSLGTRHRAALGISEITDSLTVVVSEETGAVSVAQEGRLTPIKSKSELSSILNKKMIKNDTVKRLKFWKGRSRNERKADE